MSDPSKCWRLHANVLVVEALCLSVAVGVVVSLGRIGLFNEGNDTRGWIVGLMVIGASGYALLSSLVIAVLARHARPGLVLVLAHVSAPLGAAAALAVLLVALG